MRWPWTKQKAEWPTLQLSQFVRGRAATVADMDSGHAVFCQQSSDGSLASPWPLEVPQYALWRKEDDTEVPSILVQAEAHILDPDGEPLLGLRFTDGSTAVASGGEVTLLGVARPR